MTAPLRVLQRTHTPQQMGAHCGKGRRARHMPPVDGCNLYAARRVSGLIVRVRHAEIVAREQREDAWRVAGSKRLPVVQARQYLIRPGPRLCREEAAER